MTLSTQIIVNMVLVNDAHQLMLAMDPTDTSVESLDYTTFGAGNRARAYKAVMLEVGDIYTTKHHPVRTWKATRATQAR